MRTDVQVTALSKVAYRAGCGQNEPSLHLFSFHTFTRLQGALLSGKYRVHNDNIFTIMLCEIREIFFTWLEWR